MTEEIIVQLVAALGPSGALVWHLWHTTSNTIPTLVNTHRESMDAALDRFTKSLEDERKARNQEIQALRDYIRVEAACRYNRDHPKA